MTETRDTTSLVNKIFNLNLLKFKHVFGAPEKKENCYENIKITKNACDSQFCCVNPKFLAVVTEVTGGGSFIVLDLKKDVGRQEENYGRVIGHKGPVLDIKWNPFNDNVIASCSDDCTVKIWYIPDGGVGRKPIVDSLMTLAEHKRRVHSIEWHPTADQILFSVAFDNLILIWHTATGQMVGSISCHPDTIQSFNRDGSLIATTCKDKFIRIIEPRTGKVVSKGKGHLGSKSSKVVFLGDTTRLFTTGFSKYSDRQWAIWNQYDLREPLTIENIDSSSGVMFPFYDHDTKMVYIAGKGDGSIRYYELVNEEPYCHYVSQYITGFPQRGLGCMPKRGLDTSKCEIFRFFKLHAMKLIVEPISMIVPRKSNIFQEDIYPPTAAPTPALSAEEWMNGKNKPPILISMKSNTFNKTHKPMIQNHTDVNNDKKFIFIAQDNVVDYRENGENGSISPQTNHQTQLLNQRNNSLSNNLIHHSSSHSSLNGSNSSNSYHNNLNNIQNSFSNSYNNSFNNNSFNSGRNNSYLNSPYIENLNNLNGKWTKEPDYLDEELTVQNLDTKSPKKQTNKYFYNDNYDPNTDLNELEEVRRQISNGRLIRGSTGLLLLEDAIPKNYDDLLNMYRNQLEEIHILKELNQKKDMKIKELEDLLEDFKMVDC